MLRRLRGLRAQLLLWTIVPLAVVLIILSLVGVTRHRQAMSQLVEDRNRGLALAEANRLGREIDGRAALLLRRATDHGDHRGGGRLDGTGGRSAGSVQRRARAFRCRCTTDRGLRCGALVGGQRDCSRPGRRAPLRRGNRSFTVTSIRPAPGAPADRRAADRRPGAHRRHPHRDVEPGREQRTGGDRDAWRGLRARCDRPDAAPSQPRRSGGG